MAGEIDRSSSSRAWQSVCFACFTSLAISFSALLKFVSQLLPRERSSRLYGTAICD